MGVFKKQSQKKISIENKNGDEIPLSFSFGGPQLAEKFMEEQKGFWQNALPDGKMEGKFH